MDFWVFITTHDNWKVTRDMHTVGVAERHQKSIDRVEKGNKCLIYVKEEHNREVHRKSYIIGEYEIISRACYDNTPIFHKVSTRPNETFPLRIKLKCLTPSARPVEFKPFIPKLSFIKNKTHWGGTFQGNALLKIPQDDYEIMASSLAKSGND